ncbi:MAG: hypothetical protein A2096_13910 [Spirochaetes bacterium GWF1_41_5]|nr:MAG: hypothetical protein A2096_13910 [Spirochaetes bacterium GWF1_41_5]HBE02463.1 hypothetical protein [Spirochaetia bacterium]
MSFYKAGYVASALQEWENIIKLGGQDSYLVQKINNILYLEGRAYNFNLYTDYIFQNSWPLKASLLQQFAHPSGFYIDEKNGIFALDFAKNTLCYLDANGNFQKNIIAPLLDLSANSIIQNPYEIIASGPNTFYISDFGNDRVLKISPSGEILNIIGSRGFKEGLFLGPEGMCLDEYGNIFITDSGNCRVQGFTAEGELMLVFGRKGRRTGELFLPAGIILHKNRFYIANKGNNCISIFSRYGEFIENFGDDFLSAPMRIMPYPENSRDIYYISDRENIYIYDRESMEKQSVFKDSRADAFKPNSFAFDKTGLLYVSDAATRSINLYSPVKKIYVNLNVQTENIYLRDFPLITLSVSVRDRDGNPQPGLNEKNFFLLEENQECPFRLLAPHENYSNLRVTVLAERSDEFIKRLPEFRDIANDFFSSLDPDDQAQVFSFSGKKYKKETVFNNSILKNIEAAVTGRAEGEPVIGPLLRKAVEESIKLDYRTAIVILAAGLYSEHNFNPENFHEVARFAAHNAVPVYIIYSGREPADEKEQYYFKTLARLSGGGFFFYKNRSTAAGIINQARKFDPGWYQIQYTSVRDRKRAGVFRELQVKVNYKNFTGIDNKAGYPVPDQ